MLDLRSKCRWSFQGKTLYPLFSTGSTKEDRKLSQHYWKIVDWDVKQQLKKAVLSYEGLGEPVHLCRLVRAFAARLHKIWMKMKTKIES